VTLFVSATLIVLGVWRRATRAGILLDWT